MRGLSFFSLSAPAYCRRSRLYSGSMRPFLLPYPLRTATISKFHSLSNQASNAFGIAFPSARPSHRLLSTSSSSFDIFQKLKDPPDASTLAEDKKRKPSEKVIRLVDEIMNLTLIEAADLCDLCQEKLTERSVSLFSMQQVSGRSPFPHPSAMFSGLMAPGGMMMPAMMQQPMHSNMTPQTVSLPNAAPEANIGNTATPEEENTKKETVESSKAVKLQVNIKLVSFEQSKKVAVVKEVRSITKLGLIESKELVEGAPKTLKKGVPIEEAEQYKTKLEAAGGKVELE